VIINFLAFREYKAPMVRELQEQEREMFNRNNALTHDVAEAQAELAEARQADAQQQQVQGPACKCKLQASFHKTVCNTSNALLRQQGVADRYSINSDLRQLLVRPAVCVQRVSVPAEDVQLTAVGLKTIALTCQKSADLLSNHAGAAKERG
jgi:hypothetical protein